MMKRRAAARPQAGRFRRVSRGGTFSVVEAYTSLSRSFRALAPYTSASPFQHKKSPPHGGTVLTPCGSGA